MDKNTTKNKKNIRNKKAVISPKESSVSRPTDYSFFVAKNPAGHFLYDMYNLMLENLRLTNYPMIVVDEKHGQK